MPAGRWTLYHFLHALSRLILLAPPTISARFSSSVTFYYSLLISKTQSLVGAQHSMVRLLELVLAESGVVKWTGLLVTLGKRCCAAVPGGLVTGADSPVKGSLLKKRASHEYPPKYDLGSISLNKKPVSVIPTRQKGSIEDLQSGYKEYRFAVHKHYRVLDT